MNDFNSHKSQTYGRPDLASPFKGEKHNCANRLPIIFLLVNDDANKELNARTTVVAWHIVVALVSGFILGIAFSCIVSHSRRKLKRNRKSKSKAEPRAEATYQELDLSKLNKEDNNYESLQVAAASNYAMNGEDSTYTELNKIRDVEDNYQSLK